jgi:hypothetical protein
MTPQREAGTQAFTVMADHGCCGVGQLVAQGIRETPSGRVDVLDQWVAIGECVSAILKAHRTAH